MNNIAIVIPARYGSSRLPAKPLLEVLGKPIIQYVYEASKKSKYGKNVIVATDDERIKSAVEAFGGVAEMTDKNHKCGSDRIAEIAKRHEEFDYVLNLQGDEPQITPEVIDCAIDALLEDKTSDISTLVRKITSKEQIDNPNCVKCVFDNNKNALYFSRCPIPYERNKGECDYYAHIGIYGYKKQSLLKLTSLEQADLEKQESLEQLRALKNGMKIKVAIVDLNPIGIDTKDDYEKFKKIMEEKLKA